MNLSYKVLKALKKFYNVKDFRDYLRFPYYNEEQDVILSTDGIKLIVIANENFDIRQFKTALVPINIKYIDDSIQNKQDLILNTEFIDRQKNDGLYQNIKMPDVDFYLKLFKNADRLKYKDFTIKADQMNDFVKLLDCLNPKGSAFSYIGSSMAMPLFGAKCGKYKVYCIIAPFIEF